MFKKLLSRRSMRNNEEYSLDSAWQNEAAGFVSNVEATRCLEARPRTPGFQTVDPLEVDINCTLACADMAMSVPYPEVSKIAIRKLDHVLAAGAVALGMDEVTIITEHRDELAARLQKLLTTEMKPLSPTRDLLQTTYSAAKAPLGKGENNERPQAAKNYDTMTTYRSGWATIKYLNLRQGDYRATTIFSRTPKRLAD